MRADLYIQKIANFANNLEKRAIKISIFKELEI